jgi:hypothetical protein
VTEPTKPHGEGCCEVDAPVTGPRIVSPQEARQRLGDLEGESRLERDYVTTVATEPDRIRAAVVKALWDLPDQLKPNMSLSAQIDRIADAIENGADW